MAVGYLVMNHRPAPQLVRLLTTLRQQQPDAALLVHHDRFRCELLLDGANPLEAEVFTSDHAIHWGDYSVVQACWKGISKLAQRRGIDWVILLSAQDYPIKPLAHLEALLASSDQDAYLEASILTDRPPKQADDLRHRYLYQYKQRSCPSSPDASRTPLRAGLRGVADATTFVVNRVQPFLHVYRFPPPLPRRIGWRATRTPFSPTSPCWHSSMWMVLSVKAARALLEFADLHPDFVSYYRRTAIPDESITATVLCNQAGLRIDHSGLHFSLWTRARYGHPDLLVSSDLPRLRATPHYFARKFDLNVDAHVLDLIDRQLLRSGAPAPE